MKKSIVLMGLVAGATIHSAVAAPTAIGTALAPTTATTAVVSSFVDRYVARESNRLLRHPASGSPTRAATDIALYPTADREVVFVTFRITGAEHVALVETTDGRVGRFTDFAGERPKNDLTATAIRADAQAQAQSFLSPTPAEVIVSSERGTTTQDRIGVQEQAAELLQFTSLKTATQEPGVGKRAVARSIGDSQRMARRLLTSSSDM